MQKFSQIWSFANYGKIAIVKIEREIKRISKMGVRATTVPFPFWIIHCPKIRMAMTNWHQ